MNQRQTTGRQGEDIAAHYLQEQGYEVVERNWRCAIGELDIIAYWADVLVFVEVRTRRGQQFGSPEESITPKKQQRLIELAHSYQQEMTSAQSSWRIDVVTVQLGSGAPQVNHIENAIGW